jgi:ribonuclease HI
MAKNAKSKFYVVWKGARPGIYSTWKDCEKQVKGYPGARYKGYPTRQEAEAAFNSAPPVASSAAKRTKENVKSDSGPVVWESISVDAACSGNPGLMEYRGVWTATKEEIFHQGPFTEGTNNIGEFLALVHGLAWLKERKDQTTPVYSDSRIARGWVAAGKARTKLQRTSRSEKLFKLIERAEAWLKANRWENDVLRWDTKSWGEIPADFGRK